MTGSNQCLGVKQWECLIQFFGAKFEPVDYRKIPEEMYRLDKEIQALMGSYEQMSLSEYVERVIKIHYRLTVIHA